MRHGKKFNHLSRTDSHRRALLSSLATSLIVHKRINTTVAKAKALRVYVEPLLTKSKTDSTNSRRQVFSYLQDKNSVNILFRDVAGKIADRSGGYTRIIKTGTRLGDNAEMCFIELVDYNVLYSAKVDTKKTKSTRRGRSGSGVGTKPSPLAKSTASDALNTPKVQGEVENQEEHLGSSIEGKHEEVIRVAPENVEDLSIDSPPIDNLDPLESSIDPKTKDLSSDKE